MEALLSLCGRSPDPEEGELAIRFLFSVLSGAAAPALTLDLGAESPEALASAAFGALARTVFGAVDFEAEVAFVPVLEVGFSFKELKFGPQR